MPASLPDSVGDLLRRCLQKDASQRLRDIGDARLEIEEALAALSDSRRSSGRPRSPIVATALLRSRNAVFAAAVVLLVLIGAAVLLWRPMQAAPLSDHDVLVLADFTNTTGDAVFNGTLSTGPATPEGYWRRNSP